MIGSEARPGQSKVRRVRRRSAKLPKIALFGGGFLVRGGTLTSQILEPASRARDTTRAVENVWGENWCPKADRRLGLGN
jgi:hypothetical protein